MDFDIGGACARDWFRIHALEGTGFQLADFRTEKAGRGNDGFGGFVRVFEFSRRFLRAGKSSSREQGGSASSDESGAVRCHSSDQLAAIESSRFQQCVQGDACGESSREHSYATCDDAGGQHQRRRFIVESSIRGFESYICIERRITGGC